MKEKHTEVVVIGGGILGSLLALILGLNGIKTILIDKQPIFDLKKIKADGRCYSLSKSTKNLLQTFNIWESIRNECQSVSKISLQQGLNTLSPQPDHLFFEERRMHRFWS